MTGKFPFEIVTNGVTAHRGNSAEYPENTLIAYESALSLGVDWIEIDLLKTRDGKLVAIHDYTTLRAGNFNIKIDEVNYDELRKVDIAYRFREKRKLSFQICPKMHVPLLCEILPLIKSQYKTRVSLHPKISIVEESLLMIKKLDASKWVGFNGVELEYMSMVKTFDRSIPVFFDRFQSDILQDIAWAKEHGFESIVMHDSQVSKSNIESIHDAGLLAGCWTIDDPVLMSTYLRMGIDIIYTNDPRRLLAIKGTSI